MNRKIYTPVLAVAFLICLSFISLNVFSQFEQKLTINGGLTFTNPNLLADKSNYGNGYGFDAGLQFNINRTISFFGAARFYYMFGGFDYEDAYYDNLAIGGGVKLNMLPTKRVNPYLFGEANINFIWLEEWIYDDDGYYESDFGTSVGGLAGLGFDFVINDYLGLFVQSGTYYTYWDNSLNLYSQLGVRINMIKSKTI
jgi:hypothetical protein